MGKFIDLTGQKFGKLTVVIRAGVNMQNKALWVCKCDCGKETIVSGVYLRNGHTKSCGCYRAEIGEKIFTKHNGSNTRLYRIWCGIKKRCYDRNDKDKYKYYGGRGITVCDEWRNDFQAFYDWAMSHGYADDLTIDRIDNNGNYAPLNCRWISKKEQMNNTRRNHSVTINGESKNITQWAEESGVPIKTLWYRLKKGWSGERLLCEVRKRGK